MKGEGSPSRRRAGTVSRRARRRQLELTVRAVRSPSSHLRHRRRRRLPPGAQGRRQTGFVSGYNCHQRRSATAAIAESSEEQRGLDHRQRRARLGLPIHAARWIETTLPATVSVSLHTFVSGKRLRFARRVLATRISCARARSVNNILD